MKSHIAECYKNSLTHFSFHLTQRPKHICHL